MKKLTLLFVAVALLTGGAMAKEKSCCKKKSEHCTKESACCKDKKNCKHECSKDSKENKETKQEAPKKDS